MLNNKKYLVMKNFLNGYFNLLHGRSISKNSEVSQKTTSRILIEFEKKGLLQTSLIGNIKYYKLNKLNQLLPNFLSFFESFRTIEFLEKNKKLIDFSKEVEGDIVCIFGSYARETNKKGSDLDVYIIGRVDTLKIKKMGEEFGVDVQVFNLSLSDFRKAIKERNTLFLEVLGNHVILKGQEIFTREVLKWLQ